MIGLAGKQKTNSDYNEDNAQKVNSAHNAPQMKANLEPIPIMYNVHHHRRIIAQFLYDHKTTHSFLFSKQFCGLFAFYFIS